MIADWLIVDCFRCHRSARQSFQVAAAAMCLSELEPAARKCPREALPANPSDRPTIIRRALAATATDRWTYPSWIWLALFACFTQKSLRTIYVYFALWFPPLSVHSCSVNLVDLSTLISDFFVIFSSRRKKLFFYFFPVLGGTQFHFSFYQFRRFINLIFLRGNEENCSD